MFARFWWVFLVCLLGGPLLGVAVAAICAYAAPRTYESAVVLQVRPPLPPTRITPDPTYTTDPSCIPTQIELLRSGVLSEKVIDHLDLAKRWNIPRDEARDRLHDAIEVQSIRGTDLIQITVRTTQASVSKDIAESFSQSYTEYWADRHGNRMKESLGELRRAVKQQEDTVEEKRKTITSMVRNGPVMLGSEELSRQEALKRFEFDDARADFETAQALLEKLKIRLISEEMQQRISDDPVTIHIAPTMPTTPVRPNLVRFFAVGGGSGLLFGLFAPFAIIPVAHRLSTTSPR